MSDLIDRQRAIEAVKLGITYAKLIDTETGELLEPFKASNDELKRAVQRIKNLPSAQPTFDARDTQYNLPIGTDCISRQQAIDALDEIEAEVADGYGYQYAKWREYFVEMPSAQPERTCVNCGRTANNGGWYADGRTRCPIEEHYALPKDGYCHLWEKRNVTDDDYPERREE